MGLFDKRHNKSTGMTSQLTTPQQTADMANNLLSIEVTPAYLDCDTDLQSYEKFSFAELAASGAAFSTLATPLRTIKQCISIPANGLYRVHNMGKVGHLAMKDGYNLGTIMEGNKIVGQARLEQMSGLTANTVSTIPYDPTLLILAVAMREINKRFDEVKEIGLDILDFLEQDKQAKLHSSLIYLQDVLVKYKHNCRNEKYKNSQYNMVIRIKKEALDDMGFYRRRIEKTRKNRLGSMYGIHRVEEQRKTIEKGFISYQLSLHVYSFATFLEVMLLENFDSEYVLSIIRDIEYYADQYDILYASCFRRIKGQAKTALENRLIGDVGNTIRFMGKMVEKVPIMRDLQMGKSLITKGNSLMRRQVENSRNVAAPLSIIQDSTVQPFVENLRKVDQLFNQPKEILFDENYLYMKSLPS